MSTYTINTNEDQDRGLRGAVDAYNNQRINEGNKENQLSITDYLKLRVNDILNSYATQYPALPNLNDLKTALDLATDEQRTQIALILTKSGEDLSEQPIEKVSVI